MNYTELVNAAQSYADRQDIEVAASMDIFILMAEARMNRLLKTRNQSTRALTLTVTNEAFYSLPPDYAGMRHMKFLNTDQEYSNYSYLSPDAMTARSKQPAGDANYYTILANQYQIFPIHDAGSLIEIVYYQKVPNLTSENDTNWMLDNHPDIYLSALLFEVESFTKNYEVAQAWDSKTSRGIAELDNSDKLEVWAGVPLVTRAIQ